MSQVFQMWRLSLEQTISWFNSRKQSTRLFWIKIFVAFVVINSACFWGALLTTYPQLLQSYKADEYILISGPVAILGAVFDSFSLLVTIYIIQKALMSKNNASYIAFLSVDLLIAILATFWVLFAFIISGWLVSLVLEQPETIDYRLSLYEGRAWSAMLNPFGSENIKNIYFGVVMGASALLPTLFHAFLALRSGALILFRRIKPSTAQ